jgi:RNA polymerase sigma-70 factor (ECF subfamily)
MSLEHASHAELVARVADRDAEAEVCRRFAPRIRLYGKKHLRDDDRASDLVQRVLVVVIEAIRAGTIGEPEHLDRFVLGVARNTALRIRATEARLEPVEHAALEALDLGAVMRTDALDVDALMSCVGKLDERGRTVLFLSFYRERSADEIAQALQTSPGNVRVLRHRAMVAVRDCMEGATA